MNPRIFREYDIRGIVDQDLPGDVVDLLGRGFGTYLQQQGGTCAAVGRDMRLSSPRLRDALIGGIVATGVNVLDLGEIPTPVSYFALFHLAIDGGVMITGSHNPPEYNGFKVEIGKTTIHGEEIQRFRSLIESGRFMTGQGSVAAADIVTPYIDMVKSKIAPVRPLRVGVDAGNGMGGLFAPRLLRDLGCEVYELYSELDGRFPNHHPDPTVDANMMDLMALVREKQLDLGVGFDGDADRLGVVDDQGRMVRGDQIVALFARDLLSRTPGATIIFDVKCSQGLVDDIESHGGTPLMWKTGHSLLKSKMHQEGAYLAGEMSGHIFFGENYFGYDDAIYGACLLIQVLARATDRLSAMIDSLPHYYSTPEIRAETTEEEKWGIVQQAQEYFRSKYATVEVDGVRVIYPDGWGLVRASNTQPALVLRFEATSEARVREIQQEITAKLQEFGTIHMP